MISQKKLIVSHAPFLHCGSSISQRGYHTMLAALPAVVVGLICFGAQALGVVCLSVSTAILWELAFNFISKREVSIGDGNAALLGLLFGMLLPATMPWWAVIVGTFFTIIIGKHIFGGIGGNSFNPVMVSMAILMVSWKGMFDFDGMLVTKEFDFIALYPLATLKHLGTAAAGQFNYMDLFLGQQVGGIGTTCGLAILLGGLYLILRGFIRWEIAVSFLVGIVVTAYCFHVANAEQYGGPMIHLLSGYTLIGAFFLATEDSSSPVNLIPMLLYGALGGIMTVLIRNIGIYVDGVVFAILFVNCVSPLLDKIRPKAIGKVV